MPQGGGTGGSRSLQLGGSAVHQATEALVDPRQGAGRRALLEADVADIVVDTAAGTVGVAGVPATALTWGELAATAPSRARRPAAGRPTPSSPARAPRSRSAPTSRWSRSTPRPARPDSIRHVAVDDCGTVINPLLVEGQQHGGIGSGVGQALYEEVRYDADGNPITSNFADYGLPSAAEHAELRGPLDRDAVAAQPARRQGHRRGGHDRLDAGRSRTR